MALGPATILSPSDVPPPTLVGMGSLNEALCKGRPCGSRERGGLHCLTRIDLEEVLGGIVDGIFSRHFLGFLAHFFSLYLVT